MSKIETYGQGKFSYSFLKNFAISPLTAKAYLERELKATPAMIFGRLFHACMANQVYDEFLIYNELERPELEKTMASNKNKDWKRQLIESATDSNLTLIGIDELTLAVQMREAVLSSRVGASLMALNAEVEQDYENDICKGRCDMVVHEKQLICDWKSIAKINPAYIEFDIKKYHYDAQAYIYSQVVNPDYNVLLFFVEKTEPFNTLPVLITPNSDAMNNGKAKVGLWYNQAKNSFENNEWPDLGNMYPDGLLELE